MPWKVSRRATSAGLPGWRKVRVWAGFRRSGDSRSPRPVAEPEAADCHPAFWYQAPHLGRPGHRKACRSQNHPSGRQGRHHLTIGIAWAPGCKGIGPEFVVSALITWSGIVFAVRLAVIMTTDSRSVEKLVNLFVIDHVHRARGHGNDHRGVNDTTLRFVR